jgi:hypothetical protein
MRSSGVVSGEGFYEFAVLLRDEHRLAVGATEGEVGRDFSAQGNFAHGALELLGVGARSWIAQLNANRTASNRRIRYSVLCLGDALRLPQHGLNNFFRSAQTFLLLDL